MTVAVAIIAIFGMLSFLDDSSYLRPFFVASHGRFPSNVNIPHARRACVRDLEEEYAPIIHS